MRVGIRFFVLVLLTGISNGLLAYSNQFADKMNERFSDCGGYIATNGSGPENRHCNACHGGGGFSPTISLGTTAVVPRNDSRSYTISSNAGNAAGFNLTVINSSESPLGTLSAGTGSVFDPTVIAMLRHTAPRAARSWTFTWQAPNSSTTARMCYCVNSVDLSGDESGDNPLCGFKEIIVNNKPVAVTDSVSPNEDQTPAITITPKVNDSDTESNTLDIISFSGVASIPGLSCSTTTDQCTLTIAGNYDEYDTGVNFTGSFTYALSDNVWAGNGINPGVTGTVNVTVTGVNDAPVANPDTYSVDIGNTLNVTVGSSVLANDTDDDAGEAIKNAVLVSGPSNASPGGFTLNANGSFSYTHDGSTEAGDSFTYKVNDGSADSNTTTVDITINNSAPTAGADSATVPESIVGALGTVNIDVLANDSDAETAVAGITSVGSFVNGSAVIESDNTITFTHDVDSEAPTASFQYVINDGIRNSTAATVNITVTPRNDFPVAAADAIAVDIAGTATTLDTGSSSVLTNDTDAENDGLTAELAPGGGPAHAASFVLNSDGTFSYTHDGTDNLIDSFTYIARDNSSEPSNPNAASVPVAVTISVANDPPVAGDDSATVTESIQGALGTVNIDVLANDFDAETEIAGITSVGSFVNGTAVIEANNTITFTHDVDSEAPTASFQYVINDGILNSTPATVSITVIPVNDPPVGDDPGAGDPDVISVDIAGTATTLVGGASSVLNNDTDVENDALEAVLDSGPTFASAFNLALDGSFSYTHDGTNNLTDSFTYRARDTSNALSNLVTVNITIANNAPTAIPDAVTIAEGGSQIIDVLANDTDPETTTPTVTKNLANISNGLAVINPDSTVTFTHDGNSDDLTASFEYTANDGFLDSASPGLVSITITPVNDAPQIAPIPDQVATEEVAMAVITAVGSDEDDANDGVNLTYSLSGQPAGMVISNVPGSQGEISWTPPRTGVFNQVFGPISVAVADGGEDGAPAAVTTFNVTVSPPDGDSDQVADYDDRCPTLADSSNADNDGDGTAGNDADPDDNVGGDVCDADDDNDNMPDEFEIAFNLNPFSAADANTDADGDGVSNLDEFRNGTNPLLPSLVIDATGYLTPFNLTAPAPSSIHPQATAISADKTGPFRPGLHQITWTASNASNSSLGTTVQSLGVRPLVNFHADQRVAEGSSVTVTASLNGDAVAYPVTINYSVSGTASGADHNAVSGTLVFASANQNSASVTFNVVDDGIADAQETIVFSMTGVSNAVIGSRSQTTIRILEGNLPPAVQLQVTQQGMPVSSAFIADGAVTVTAVVNDPNAGQSHSYDWSASSNALSPPATGGTSSWSFSPSAGVFALDVLVTDNGSPSGSARARRLLRVSADAPPVLGNEDSDGDGVIDSAEGYGDSDEDGIADYLDAVGAGNVLQDQTSQIGSTRLLQAEQGMKLKIGGTAYAAGVAGAAITDQTIASFGGVTGQAPQNAIDSFEHVGGVFDFEISQFAPGSSVRLVLPLQTAIPRVATYRKFDASTGWTEFVDDGFANRLYSAAGESGVCPEPGSSAYSAGMTYLHSCLQILIQDGGPNDPDGVADGVVRDPGTIGVQLREPAQPVLEQGGGLGLGIWSLLLLSLLGLFRISVRRYRQ